LANASLLKEEKPNENNEKKSTLNNLEKSHMTFLKSAIEPINRVFESWEETFQLRRKLYLNASLSQIFLALK